MVGYVYKITNIINNKVYIGITSRDVELRFIEHKSRARCEGYGHYLHMAINKYGEENFIVETLHTTVDIEEALEIEYELIKYYNSTNKQYGYNLTDGGQYTKVTQEVKDKISNSKLGHSVSQDTRDKVANKLSKQWKVIYPDGQEHMITNLNKFSRDNNLCHKMMHNVANPNQPAKQCKGFRVYAVSNGGDLS